MRKKVVVISTSLRSNSNSAALADQFAKGATEAGNAVDIITLRGKSIGFCTGCLACQKTGCCVIKDDALAIAEKVLHADVKRFALWELGLPPMMCRPLPNPEILCSTAAVRSSSSMAPIAGHTPDWQK